MADLTLKVWTGKNYDDPGRILIFRDGAEKADAEDKISKQIREPADLPTYPTTATAAEIETP